MTASVLDGPICYKPRCNRAAKFVDDTGWKWCASHVGRHAVKPIREIKKPKGDPQ